MKPTFIYGGESFGLFPPRVTDGYGSGIEELLSNGAIKALADFMPGLIKVNTPQPRPPAPLMSEFTDSPVNTPPLSLSQLPP